MKHVRLLCALLALLLLVMSFTACSVSVTKKNTLMALGKSRVTVNTYELLLSRLKGNMAWSVTQAGQKIDSDTFWDTIVDMDGTTMNRYYSDAVLATLKEYLIALYLFDEELKLKLPDETVKEIDDVIDELIEYDADGSKTTFNKILSEYGVNHKMLREVYLLEAKYDALQTHLYGANGSLIASSLKDSFCREKFVACKQIFVANYFATGETDADGRPIYEDYGEEKLAEQAAKAEAARAEAESVRDAAAFEALIAKYSDREAVTIYLQPDTTYGETEETAYLDDITKALVGMEVGEVAYFPASDGWHILMKYEIEDGAADDAANADWFENDEYSLSAELASRLFHEKCAAYLDRVVVYDAVLAVAPDMKSVSTNYYY